MKKIAFIIAISIIIPLKCYAFIGMNNELNEKVVFIKVGSGFLGRDIKLETTIYKPNGNGPFPLFVLIPQKQKGNPANQPRARYVNFSAELVNRGYAVAIPMPKGYSNSSGQFDQKNCEIRKIAEEQSNDVNHVIKFLKTLDFIDQNQVILAGHSFDGISALANQSSLNNSVKIILNFSGVVRFDECDWEKPLISTVEEFGTHAKINSIWFYGISDTIAPPDLADSLLRAFNKTKKTARIVRFQSPAIEAHSIFATNYGFSNIWWPAIENELLALNFPVHKISEKMNNRFSKEQPNNVLDKIPTYADKKCIEKFGETIDTFFPLSFSFSNDGSCGYSPDPDEALNICQHYSKDSSCRLFSIDRLLLD